MINQALTIERRLWTSACAIRVARVAVLLCLSTQQNTFARSAATGRNVSAEAEPDTTIGVEGARTLRYQGPALEAKPLQEKAPLLLRIARTTDEGEAKVYDVRYVGVRPGSFNLRDYLRRVDGGPLDGLPAAMVTVGQLLPEDHDGRLADVRDPPKPRFWPYRLTLWVIGGLWLAPVALISLRWALRLRTSRPEARPPPHTLANQLRPLLEAAIAGRLSAAEKSRLEMLLIAHWRERLGLADRSLMETLEHLRRHPAAAEPLRQLAKWLHHRPGSASIDVAAALAPYREQPAITEEVLREEAARLPRDPGGGA